MLLVLGVFAPSVSIAALPAATVLLYFLSLAVGVWVLPVAAAVYFAASLLVSGMSIFATAGAVIIVALVLPRCLRKKLPLVWEIALCAGVGIVAVCGALGVYALASGTSVTDVIVANFADLTHDPVVWAVAKRHYRTLTAQVLGHAPYVSADELYATDVLTAYADSIGRELEDNLLWYLTGFGTFAGGLAGAGALAIASCDGTVAVTPLLRDVRFGKTYLLSAVLPALAFALLALYAPMRPVVRTVINVMVTLPTTLCGITLLFHSACRFGGKGRVAAIVVFWLLMAVAAFFYEWGMLILGFLGLADCVLNVRKMLDWALS